MKGGGGVDKFPLCWNGKSLGELTVEVESLYSCFSVRCRLPWQGIWCVWLVGEKGELRLGIPEPQRDDAVIRRRFSNRMTAPLGRLLRGELRPAASAETVSWEPAACDSFRTPWLRRQLQTLSGALTRQTGRCRFLAVPYDEKSPFPLPPLFCFARIRQIAGETYAVFAFDQEEWPVFSNQ